MSELSKNPEEGHADSLRQGLLRYDAENPAKHLEISTETANTVNVSLEDAANIAEEFIYLYPETLTDDPRYHRYLPSDTQQLLGTATEPLNDKGLRVS